MDKCHKLLTKDQYIIVYIPRLIILFRQFLQGQNYVVNLYSLTRTEHLLICCTVL